MDRQDYQKVLDEFTEDYPIGTCHEFDEFIDFICYLGLIVDKTVFHYITDFALDTATLGTSYGRNEKTRFVFITRENGTWLFEKTYDDFFNEKENHQSFKSMKSNYGYEFCAFEIWFDAHNESYKVERKF